jgi:hypothetical protein
MGSKQPKTAHSVMPAAYTERTTCRVCDHHELETILDLGDQYLANFVRVKDASLPRCPLVLVQCGECGTLQLKHSINGDLIWREYWYRSSINQTMRDALGDVVNEAKHYAREGRWLDIGANDGYLLSRVGERFSKVACEPALNMHPLLEEHADKIIGDYFSVEKALEQEPHYEVVTSCAMFYDLDEPQKFVDDVAKCLSPSGVWINQLNDAPGMLKANAFDGICHEHRLYLDVPTIRDMYKKADLSIVGLSYNDINGGSVRIAAMKGRNTGVNPVIGVPRTDYQEVQAFARRVERWKILMNELLDMPTFRETELWGLGASTKSCCMLQYLGKPDRFVAIGDRNPAKWGTFQAGTWIPVMDEATMRKARPGIVVPLIWAFRKEIMLREAQMLENGSAFLFPLPHPEIVT